jgi:diguanylate cyclase (GGDEF)-like protein
MTAQAWQWAAIAGILIALLLIAQGRRRFSELRTRASEAERKVALLTQIAPPMTEGSMESVAATCSRVVERFGTLIRGDVILCFVEVDGRLVLGAKSDVGYAGFLRVGDSYEGDSILTWTQNRSVAAVTGPVAADLPSDVDIADLFKDSDGARLGAPLAGSRDRVWALCIPMTLYRGYGLRPAYVGALYAERKKETPFSHGDIRTALLTAQLAGDALTRARFADAIRKESEIDPLTQLLTAGAFRKRLREEVEKRRYDSGPASKDIALFFIDTDQFKSWNDTFGHTVGDMLLKRLAQTFEEVARSGGFAGRNGGDEFCIALFDRTKDDAVETAERLRAKVEQSDLMGASQVSPARRIPVTISIGVAHFPVDVPRSAHTPADKLLEAADACMYEAKRCGRNRVEFSRIRALPRNLRYPGEGPIPRR